MAESDFNNNGEAIDATLDALGLRPAPLPAPIEDPIATGPFADAPFVQRVTALEQRVVVLEGKIGVSAETERT